ncbi:hypothetical protein ODZ84_14785 [Chryseobacterium fluminis]|uniref:hypothetical protein n=1 Tax=Chryseobacterium fluminis TaxID=2983606 RepID=UPI0022572276|nr:hypothetical protein [Chryseobacterium sp. MMS21-Ot14]UZT96485.1 hypothetical protein ODZ84_14785 [Chryseobacterium sp. MMS21-Ot14]
MRKKITFLMSLTLALPCEILYGQIGINTAQPQATLDITAKQLTGTATNPDGILVPRVDRQRAQSMTSVVTSTIIYIRSISNGSRSGTTADVDTVGFYYFNGTKWVKLNSGEKGTSKSSIYYLPNNQNNFLNGIASGSSQNIPISVSTDGADGVTYSTSTNTFTFTKAGFYKFVLTYEATHNATDCTISPYFADFPDNDRNTVRIHSTASHSPGGASQHGGSIVYATALPANSQWKVALGRGSSGNCSGPGMLLRAKSTIVEITSIAQ